MADFCLLLGKNSHDFINCIISNHFYFCFYVWVVFFLKLQQNEPSRWKVDVNLKSKNAQPKTTGFKC